MSDTVKIVMTLSTRYVGSEVKDTYEIPKEDWDAMTPEEQENLMRDLYDEFLSNSNYGGYWVDEE